MDLKKSLFGGYKKDSVDAVIKQLTENEEQAQAKIALLDNEFRLSKESAQKTMESIQTELVIRQKSLLDMTRTLEEKNSRIAELELKQRTIMADFEEQYHAIISKLEEQHRTKVAQLEEEYNAKTTDLERKYQQNAQLIQQKDDQVKKIGQLYVDAQEYTEKMKMETKVKTLESIDRVFHELNKTQEQFETSFAQIAQKKKNLKQLMGEMLENLNLLQNKVDSMDNEPVNLSSSFDNMKYVKDQIRRQIQDEFDNDRKIEKEPPLPKTEFIAKENSYEEIPKNQARSQITEPVHEQAAEPIREQAAEPVREERIEKVEPQVNYAAQIEELKQKIERQEELLQLRTRFANMTNTMEEPVVDNKPDLIETPAFTAEPASEISEEIRSRNERELAERENYSKYFAEIEKKYCKEPQSASFGGSSSANGSGSAPSDSLFGTRPCAVPSDVPADMPAEPDPIGMESAGITVETAGMKKEEPEDTDNPVSKKPSIKDILNKYANMK